MVVCGVAPDAAIVPVAARVPVAAIVPALVCWRIPALKRGHPLLYPICVTGNGFRSHVVHGDAQRAKPAYLYQNLSFE